MGILAKPGEENQEQSNEPEPGFYLNQTNLNNLFSAPVRLSAAHAKAITCLIITFKLASLCNAIFLM
jgi:hypothetical protein